MNAFNPWKKPLGLALVLVGMGVLSVVGGAKQGLAAEDASGRDASARSSKAARGGDSEQGDPWAGFPRFADQVRIKHGETKGEDEGATDEVGTVLPKSFLKKNRFELSFHIGGETINPFVHHWYGSIAGTWHLTEVFAVEAQLGYAPPFGKWLNNPDLDLRYLTIELENSASVRPTATQLGAFGHAGVVYSPFYGKYASRGRRIVNFDLYFMLGTGVLSTHDLDENEAGEPVYYEATTDQVHIAPAFGFGFRSALSPRVALRIQGREYVFVETFTRLGQEDEVLNMVYYFMADVGLSVFFGRGAS